MGKIKFSLFVVYVFYTEMRIVMERYVIGEVVVEHIYHLYVRDGFGADFTHILLTTDVYKRQLV